MSAIDTHTAVLERVRSSLTAEGFDVILHPSSLQLPEFLQGFRPDAIAMKGDEGVIVEVVSRSSGTDHKIRQYRNAIAGRSNWSLRTVWTSGHTVPSRLEAPSRRVLEQRVSEIEKLLQERHFDAAMLMCWATLEGAARKLIPSVVERPQTPRRLVEQLAQFGLVDRTEAKVLRELTDIRNKFIHGDLTLKVNDSQIFKFFLILQRLVLQ